jgi:hypothetical protein
MANTTLSRSISSTPTNPDKFTVSMWIKKSKVGAEQVLLGNYSSGNFRGKLQFKSDDKLEYYQVNDGNATAQVRTNRVFRDVNAWYHLVVQFDTSQSTASDRIKIYINNSQETSFAITSYPAQNLDMRPNQASTTLHIGSDGNSGNYFNGVLSHFHLVDGYIEAPTVFGETDSTTGEWKINTTPSISEYGDDGFFVLKDGNSVTDQSGKGNNFTVASGTLTKTEDCPSNVFATLNPLLTHAAHGYSLTYGLGNNKITFNEPSTWTYITSTTAGINGKFYAEFKVDAVGSEASIGVIASDTVSANQTSGGLNDYLGKETDSIGYLNDGRTFKNNSAQQTGLTAISAGNILGVALDTENNTCQFYINGSSSGNPVSLTADKFYHFGVSGYNGTQISCNFGNGYFGTTAVSSAGTNASNNGIFEYDVPTGYTALSTKGLNQ